MLGGPTSSLVRAAIFRRRLEASALAEQREDERYQEVAQLDRGRHVGHLRSVSPPVTRSGRRYDMIGRRCWKCGKPTRVDNLRGVHAKRCP